jgi:hypothetical protein
MVKYREKDFENKFCALIENAPFSVLEPQKARMMATLKALAQHYLPSVVEQFSPEMASSRAEGFFGLLKNLDGHEPLAMPEMLESVRQLGHQALFRSQRQKVPALEFALMAEGDQKLLGLFAQQTIAKERNVADTIANHLGSEQLMRKAGPWPDCCHTARVHRLPCGHLIYARIEDDWEGPLIGIGDIPERWRRHVFPLPVDPVHQITRVTPSPSKSHNWSFSDIEKRFERWFSDAQRSQEIQRILSGALTELEGLLVPVREGADDDTILDPGTIPLPGARDMHPSRRSPLARTSGRPGRRRRSGRRHCRLCGDAGHDRRTCPQRRRGRNPGNSLEYED